MWGYLNITENKIVMFIIPILFDICIKEHLLLGVYSVYD